MVAIFGAIIVGTIVSVASTIAVQRINRWLDKDKKDSGAG